MIDQTGKQASACASTQPRANAACYDRKLDQVIVALSSGCTFTFPPSPPPRGPTVRAVGAHEKPPNRR